MYTGLIAKRYAGALLEFACPNGEADTVYTQARELVKFFSSDKHIKAEMASPVIPAKMKRYIAENNIDFYIIDAVKIDSDIETESIIKSLKRGERATLSGRVTLRPEMRQKMGLNCQVENVIKVKADVSSVIDNALSDVHEFEASEIKQENTKSRQIPSFL